MTIKLRPYSETIKENMSKEELIGRIGELEAEIGEAHKELLYIMELYETESWNCEICGHSEETKTMNGAYFLSDWLIAHGLRKPEEAT